MVAVESVLVPSEEALYRGYRHGHAARVPSTFARVDSGLCDATRQVSKVRLVAKIDKPETQRVVDEGHPLRQGRMCMRGAR